MESSVFCCLRANLVINITTMTSLPNAASDEPTYIPQCHLPPDDLVRVVARTIRERIEDFEAFGAAVEQFTETIHETPRATIDYSDFALALLYRYYVVNYVSASLTARCIWSQSVENPTLLEVGTGSGPGLVGFLNGLTLDTQPASVRVVAVEPSPDQRHLFEDVSWSYLTDSFTCDVTVKENLNAVTPADISAADHVLESHAFTEMSTEELRTFTHRLRRHIGSGGLTAIEQAESGVLSLLDDQWNGHSFIERGRGDYEVPNFDPLSQLPVPTTYRTSFALSFGHFER